MPFSVCILLSTVHIFFSLPEEDNSITWTVVLKGFIETSYLIFPGPQSDLACLNFRLWVSYDPICICSPTLLREEVCEKDSIFLFSALAEKEDKVSKSKLQFFSKTHHII
jgi:hypothetical protein